MKYIVKYSTYRFNCSVQPENLFLQQMQSTRFASMPGKCSSTSAVNTIHPILQFNLQIIEKKNDNIEKSLDFKNFIPFT